MRMVVISSAVVMLAFVAGAQGPMGGRGRGGFGPPPGGPGPRFLGAEAGMPGRVVKNAPYSADVVTETTHALADGNKIHQTHTTKVYRDSEGRTRRESSLSSLTSLGTGQNLPQMVFISDPVAGTNFALNANEHTAMRSTWHGPPAGRSGARSTDGTNSQGQGTHERRANPNLKTESLGQQSIEGVTATGTRATLTIPAGEVGNEQPISIVTESWYSSDLQMVVMSKRSDPRSGDFVTRMTNVSRSEPSRTLFEVPADYKVSDAVRRGGGATSPK